jgi:3-oxoacyl-[acyl-carrier protein] reductase
MIIDFKDRVSIVTGGGHGLGRAIAHALVARGSRVWACDVNREPLAETKAGATPAEGGALDCATVDVSDRDAVGKFVEAIVASTGRIDIVVCSAGGVRGQVHQPVENVTPTQFQEIFDANVKGVFNFAQAVVPHMKRAGHGRIVVISSGAGIGISLTGIQAYASAKAAAIGLTRQLAHELGPFGITVNSVAPGFVRSNPSSEKQWQSYGEVGQKALVERIAMKRLGTPADIANAVMFFASEHAAWVTGQVLSVDGGK